MYSEEKKSLCNVRLDKAKQLLSEAQKMIEFEMFESAANRSYYSIFHSMRAVLALDGEDFKKHSGVIQYFQREYIKTGVFDKHFSKVIKSAFTLRTESDYEDFYIISKEEVQLQVEEANTFYEAVSQYITEAISE